MSSLKFVLKDLEFHLPAAASRLAMRAGAIDNPYGEDTERTRAIFIHIPKTAGTSLAKALSMRRGHIPAARYRAADPARFDRYFKFCFVRNPFDRLHSAYNYLRQHADKTGHQDYDWAREHLGPYDSFEDFVLALRKPSVRAGVLRYNHFRPQHHWVRLPFGAACAMDKVGRFETLAEDYRAIAGRLDLPAADLPVTRVGPKGGEAGDYRAVYTEPMKAIAADIYARDLTLFGYGFA
ncbi:MAG TPA: sulfotransferase family 2 domain-containing protein [Caulobacteraceae bacterium]